MNDMMTSLEQAKLMDESDPLRRFRNEFLIPKKDNKPMIYFCGNSLGLQPKRVKAQICEELDKWEDHGVEGHFLPSQPWITYHEELKKNMSVIVGAQPGEIAVMNTLTVNIHLMMVSFYNPTPHRYKILCEHGIFPSDMYAMMSQASFRGLEPEDVIIELHCREGENTLRTEDILQAIRDNGNELALVFFGGVNYYTGQAFDIKAITAEAHKAGATAGFDLAHAAGNISLSLHDANVDFAVWCTYKYLNSGPGGISAVFIHERHANRTDLNRFTGWWGNHLPTRFKMNRKFEPAHGADAWQLSTSPIMLMAPLKSSLEIFSEAGFGNMLFKRKKLTACLENIINDLSVKYADSIPISIITPESEKDRGAQLSLVIKRNGRAIFEQLAANGIIADWREPEVIRVAPVPLYNTFEEVFMFGKIFDAVLEKETENIYADAAV